MRVFFILVFLSFSLVGMAQPKNGYRHYGSEDGLIDESVYAVMQDSKGFIWISTSNGVSRYNGYEFENFTTKEGLINNCVFFSSEDASGKIWFVGLSPELCFYSYKHKAILPYKFNDRIAKLNVQEHFRMSLVVHENEDWVGNWLNGFYHVNQQGRAIHELGHPGMNLNGLHGESLIFESYGEGVLNNNGPIAKYGTEFQQIHIDENKIAFGFPMRPGWQELFSAKGHLFVKFINALFEIQKDTIVQIRADGDMIGDISFDADSNLLISYSRGLYGYRSFYNIYDNAEKPELQLEGVLVNSFATDSEQNLWIASKSGCYFKNKTAQIKPVVDLDNIISQLEVEDILCDQFNDIYLQMADGKIYRCKEDDKPRLMENASPFNLEKSSLYTDLTTNQILDQRKLDSTFIELLHMNDIEANMSISVQSLYQPEAGQKWFATERAIYLFDGGRLKDKIDLNTSVSNRGEPLDQFLVNVMFQNDTALFIAMPIGFFKYNRNQLTRMNTEHPLLDAVIVDIKAGRENEIFLASKENGLLIWKSDTIIALNESQGLSHNSVSSIALDEKGDLWVGTMNGLNRVRQKSDRYQVIQVLSTIQGFPSNQITKIVIRNNELWVGTSKGLVVLDRTKIKPNSVPPFMHITGFQVDEVDTTLLDHYEFAHDQNYFVINYTGIAFKNAGNLDYEYQLEGLDKKWLQTKTRSVRYNKLAPGDYTFKVKAANEDGYWSDTASMSFTILPPYWQTWWFRLSALSLLALVLAAAFRYRLNQIKAAAATKHRMIELELKSLRAQMNPHFTFNSLLSIQRFIMDNDALQANDYLSDFAALMRRVLENSRLSQITLENELQTLKMYLDLEKLRFKEKFSYQIDIAHDVPMGLVEVPSNLLQPYVENAMVHGIIHRLEEDPDSEMGDGQTRNIIGKLDIMVRIEGRHLLCIIQDNGVGRKRSEEINLRSRLNKHSLGMEITRERLDLLKEQHGELIDVTVTDLMNEEGVATGTRVELKIPRNEGGGEVAN